MLVVDFATIGNGMRLFGGTAAAAGEPVWMAAQTKVVACVTGLPADERPGGGIDQTPGSRVAPY